MARTSRLGTLRVDLEAATLEFRKRLREAKKELSGVTDVAAKVGVGAAASFGVGTLAIGRFIKSASDANEQLNVIAASFGEVATPAIQEWAEELSSAIGRSEAQILDFAGSTQAMLAPMIGSSEAAADMSKEISKLAIDIGSFNNVADTDALTAIKAALVGSTEPMRRFGVVMTVASLEAFALSKGIKTTVKDMSEAQKVALRYAFILDKTNQQQGDATRTASGFANMQKRVAGQFQDLSAEMGKIFLQIAARILGIVSDMIDKFRGLSPEMKKAAGVAVGVFTAAAGLLSVLSGIALVLPTLSAGWGLMNKMMKPVITSAVALKAALLKIAVVAGMVIELVGALKLLKQSFDDIEGLREKLGIEEGDGFFDAFGKVAKGAFKEGVDTITAPISGIFEDAVKNASGKLDDIGPSADDLIKDFNSLGDKTKEVEPTDFSGLDLSGAFDTFNDELADAFEKEGLVSFDFSQIPVDEKDVGEAIQKLVDKAVPPAADIVSITERIDKIKGQLENALMGAAQTIVSSLGEFGQIASSAMEGFKVGGPIGAIVAVIVELLTRLEGFSDSIEIMNEDIAFLMDSMSGFGDAIRGLTRSLSSSVQGAFKAIGNALNSFAKGFGPFLQSIGKITVVINNVIRIIFEVLEPVLFLLGKALEGVGFIIEMIIRGFVAVFNFVVDIFSKIPIVGDKIEKFKIDLDDVSRASKETAAAMRTLKGTFEDGSEISRDFADFSRTAAQDVADLLSIYEQIGVEITEELFNAVVEAFGGKLEEAVEDVGDGMEDLGETLREVNGELTNVPTGLKIAAARFGATDVDVPELSNGNGGPFQTSNPAIRLAVNIGGDLSILTDTLEAEAEWTAETLTGTPVFSANNTFATPGSGE